MNWDRQEVGCGKAVNSNKTSLHFSSLMTVLPSSSSSPPSPTYISDPVGIPPSSFAPLSVVAGVLGAAPPPVSTGRKKTALSALASDRFAVLEGSPRSEPEGRNKPQGDRSGICAAIGATWRKRPRLGWDIGLTKAEVIADDAALATTRPLSPPWREDDREGHYVYDVGENLTPRCIEV